LDNFIAYPAPLNRASESFAMLRWDDVKAAIEHLLSTALLEAEWGEALERFAKAAEADGAAIVRINGRNSPAWLSSSGFAEVETLIWSGRAPSSPRRIFPDEGFEHGFHTDNEFFSADELARDPYYQEFLRPRGVFWHAKAKLVHNGAGVRTTLTLKRPLKLVTYQPQDIAVLNSLFKDLQAVVRVARAVLDREMFGRLDVISRGERIAFELDSHGRVLREHAAGKQIKAIWVSRGQLRVSGEPAQRSIDRAVAGAVSAPAQPAVVAIFDADEGYKYLQLLPLPMAARDVFHAATAIAIIIDPTPRPGEASLALRAMSDACGLTRRETQLAARLAAGLSVGQAANDLKLTQGTARNHLKSIFAKTGTSRQGELIALLSRFSL
jgi:DNA-binding CsgD family transcriptional regulator